LSIYVVTGGAGFIGSHLATHLGRAGHHVRIVDNFSGIGSRRRVDYLADVPNITIIEGDIRDPAVCYKACSGADFVLHHAAEPSVVRSIEEPEICAAINIGGTINMLRAAHAAKTIRRFVFASSCAVYGDTSATAKQECAASDPITPYATSKLAGEHFCLNFYRLFGLQTVALRYFNVYGPGQDPNGAYAAVIPKFITAIARGEKPVVYGDGVQSRDFVYIDDIIDANLLATTVTRPVGGKVFNIGSGQRISLNQLIEKLEGISGKVIAVERRDPRPGDIKHSHADISAASELLQFLPAIPLDEGLARTMQWYQVGSEFLQRL
jgi:UDP-N-acetylglucosamine/UDP-N-acetylgalactosamine 4-epimerase